MATPAAVAPEKDLKKKEGVEVTEKEQLHRIRITLTGRDHKSLEKGIFCIHFFDFFHMNLHHFSLR